MQVIDCAPAMQAWADRVRCSGQRIGFVPTMGYLHDGHLSLVQTAQRRCDRCVVSIFVNPLQFGAGEDLERYPQDLDRDRRRLRDAGVDVLYLPSRTAMYRENFQTEVLVSRVTQGLCGRSRPEHFRGVTTVVTKLFNAVKPHVAVFGEKDFQQLVTIRRLVADLDFDVQIVGAPIFREPDGLAMSSRNAYLSAEERHAAGCLPRALAVAKEAVTEGERDVETLLGKARSVLDAEPTVRVDYVELVDPDTMQRVPTIGNSTLLALAVYVGRTRLIDNVMLDAVQ